MNRDFKFLDCMLGHQGSGSSFPSVKDEVERFHLRNHGSGPHTPEICKIELRTIEEIKEHHVANVLDDRGDSHQVCSLAIRGKHHKSIVSSPIFPIMFLENVVPPVLHITLGIVLKLFKMLLNHAKSQESQSVEPHHENECAKEWQEESKEFVEKENIFKKVCCKVLDLLNFKARFLAKFESETDEKLDEIAKLPNNVQKS